MEMVCDNIHFAHGQSVVKVGLRGLECGTWLRVVRIRALAEGVGSMVGVQEGAPGWCQGVWSEGVGFRGGGWDVSAGSGWKLGYRKGCWVFKTII